MPTYAYRCTVCSHEFETVQRFSDDPLTICPDCGQPIRRVFHPVGVVFKGSGWYINDSRNASSSTTASANGSSDSSKKADSKVESGTATADSAKSESSPTPLSASSDTSSKTAKAAAD